MMMTPSRVPHLQRLQPLLLRTLSSAATGTAGAAPTFRQPRIVCIAGSTSPNSVNNKLLSAAVSHAESLGATVSVVDVRAHRLPLYDTEIEEKEGGLPSTVIAIKQEMMDADGLLLACPEFNGSVTPMLKNLLDWCSRPHEKDEATYACYKGKAAGLLSASPGALGGLRGLNHVRDIMGNLGCQVVSKQAAVGGAYKAFAEDGSLANEGQRSMVNSTVDELFHLSRDLANRASVCEIAQRAAVGGCSEEDRASGEFGHLAGVHADNDAK